MLYYDGIDVSEWIDVNKTGEPKEYDICHYWYFLNKRFKFPSYICNRYHHLLMMSMKIKNAAYHCIVSGISKSEVINILQNIDWTEKGRTL